MKPEEVNDSFRSESFVFVEPEKGKSLNWKPWKTGAAYIYNGRPLIVMKQENNEPSEDFKQRWGKDMELKSAKYRIEVHIYVNEWVTIMNKLMDSHHSIENIPGLATKLLIMVAGHVKVLSQNWFKNMIEGTEDQPCITYFPCWKCYAGIEPTNEGKYLLSKLA